MSVDAVTKQRPAAVDAPGALLEVRKVEVTYHRAVIAIQGISLSVPDSGRVALLGTNGAGKSTTLRAISGLLAAEDVEITDGSVHFAGALLNGLAPHVIAARGVALVPERDKIFMTLRVIENLQATPVGGSRDERDAALDRTFHYFPALKRKQKLTAGLLSGGERQMLALGMSLMSNPRLLLVDEMSLGLAPRAVSELGAILLQINADLDVAMLIVEQNAEIALDLVEHAYIIENGRIVIAGAPARLREHEDVREFYLGRGAAAGADARSYRDVKQYRRQRRWYG